MNTVLDKQFERFDRVFSPIADQEKAWWSLARILRHGQGVGDASFMMIIGESGSGKSQVLRNFLRWNPPYDHGDRTICPVVHIDAPNRPEIVPLNIKILQALDHPDIKRLQSNHKPGAAQLTQEVIEYTRRVGVRLIMIDEIHNLVKHNKAGLREEPAATKTLKTILNAGHVAICGAGTPDAKVLYNKSSELSRRVHPIVDILPMDWKDPEGYQDFRDLCLNLKSEMPIELTSNISPEWLLPRLYEASGGYAGSVAKLLRSAVEEADVMGKDRVDVDLLADAFVSSPMGREATRNPFRPNSSRKKASSSQKTGRKTGSGQKKELKKSTA